MYTSLELSKKLKENGCELHSNFLWAEVREGSHQLSDEFIKDSEITKNSKLIPANDYYAYDILNDICVKYAKEMFGSKDIDLAKYNGLYQVGGEYPANYLFPSEILYLIQTNKTQEAEDYIWNHCKFNKDNK